MDQIVLASMSLVEIRDSLIITTEQTQSVVSLELQRTGGIQISLNDMKSL